MFQVPTIEALSEPPSSSEEQEKINSVVRQSIKNLNFITLILEFASKTKRYLIYFVLNVFYNAN
jgi:hypothetical protein